MRSIFLEGLKTAREIIACADDGDGLARLDSLIAEHEADLIETTALRPDAETR